MSLIEFRSVSKRFFTDVDVSSRYAILEMILPRLIRFGKMASQFLALEDISFSVKSGESVLILGDVGSGKSTLAKLVGKILLPDEGVIAVNGRCNLISNVTAGFKPMLSVRENVVFKSVLLGTRREEALDRIGEILAFAGLEKLAEKKLFDLPVEFTRKLGYAISLNTSADCYIFDGKIGGGDAEFTSRCFERLMELRLDATLIILSRSPSGLSELALRLMVLDRGRLVYDGEPEAGYAVYEKILCQTPDNIDSDESLSDDTAEQLEEYEAASIADFDETDSIVGVEGNPEAISAEEKEHRGFWKTLDFNAYLKLEADQREPQQLDERVGEHLRGEQRYANARHFRKNRFVVMCAEFNKHDILFRDLIPLVPITRPVQVTFAFTPKESRQVVTEIICEFFSATGREIVKALKMPMANQQPIELQRLVEYRIELEIAEQALPAGQYGMSLKFWMDKPDGRKELDTYKLIMFSVVQDELWTRKVALNSAWKENWKITSRPLKRAVYSG